MEGQKKCRIHKYEPFKATSYTSQNPRGKQDALTLMCQYICTGRIIWVHCENWAGVCTLESLDGRGLLWTEVDIDHLRHYGASTNETKMLFGELDFVVFVAFHNRGTNLRTNKFIEGWCLIWYNYLAS